MWLYICKSFYASQLSREASPRDGQRSLPGLCQTGSGAWAGAAAALGAMARSGPTTGTLRFGRKRPQNVAAFYSTLAAEQPRPARSHGLTRLSLSYFSAFNVPVSIVPNTLPACLAHVDCFQSGSRLQEARGERHAAGVS